MHKKKNSRWFYGFILLSLLIHALILVILSRTIPASFTYSTFNDSPLKSYIFVAKPQTSLPINLDTLGLTLATTELVPQNFEQVEQDSIEAATPVHPIESAVFAEQNAESEVYNQPVKDFSQNLTPISSEEVKNTALINKQNIVGAVREYQAAINSQAIQQMAEQGAKDYQKRRLSPVIQPPAISTREERGAILRRVEIDCTNAAKQGLSFVSGLLGSTIECRKNSTFQEYIDKRLEKDASLDQNN
jgi:hypothetical protein